MDSLTQVILGAAVGEAVLGKKIGHRAMVWGGFAGFLPDLDVAASFVTDEVTALAAHRGISHSIFFAVTFSAVIAWAVFQLYAKGIYQKKWFKIASSVSALGLLGFTLNLLTFRIGGAVNWPMAITTLVVSAGLILLLNKVYYQKERPKVEASYKNWYWLFFWSIITHPLLDCFTTYGTQLFLPFTDFRVAFNVISVADPLYTVPFLICLIVAGIMTRGTNRRAITNWLGIGLSSAYMLFCVYHKFQMNRVFEAALAKENIAWNRYMTTPQILNNYLWQGVAETDDAYYQGYYTFMSDNEEIAVFNRFPKNNHLLEPYKDDPTLETLCWFSNNYCTATEREDGSLQFNDVRFGIMKPKIETNKDFIFKFVLTTKEDGSLDMHQSEDKPDISGDLFSDYVDQVMAR